MQEVTALKQKPFDQLDRMIKWEQGELPAKETIELFSELIKSKTCWNLQGAYGRQATHFINEQYLTHNGTILYKGLKICQAL